MKRLLRNMQSFVSSVSPGLLLSATQRPGLCTAQHPRDSLYALQRPLLIVTVLHTVQFPLRRAGKKNSGEKNSLFTDTQTTLSPVLASPKARLSRPVILAFNRELVLKTSRILRFPSYLMCQTDVQESTYISKEAFAKDHGTLQKVQ